MPLIEIRLLAGRTAEQKRELLGAVTEAVQRSLGAPLPSIRVWIQELAAEEYMVGGRLRADALPGADKGHEGSDEGGASRNTPSRSR